MPEENISKTTLPVINEEIIGQLRRDYPQISENCVKYAVNEILPWIEKCNPIAYRQINNYAIAHSDKALEEIATEFGREISKDLIEIIKRAFRRETVTSAALLYKMLDVQGEIDKFKKEFGGK